MRGEGRRRVRLAINESRESKGRAVMTVGGRLALPVECERTKKKEMRRI